MKQNQNIVITTLNIVSVITPFYNAGKYIEESFLSVINQKCPKNHIIEYILINDCSTDNSLEVVNNLIEKYSNISYINIRLFNLKENLGCGGARKFGIDNSIGKYLMFLDADDLYLNTDFIYRAVNDIINNNADIVEYGVKYNMFKNADGNNICNCVKEKMIVENDQETAEILLFRNNIIKFHVWCKIIDRKVANSFPYSIKRTFEDVDTIPIWIYNAKKIVIMPSVEILYRTPEKSIITTDPLQTRIGTIETITELFPKFKDNHNILRAMYHRSLIDLKAILLHGNSMFDEFNKLSKLNTYMLSMLYPNDYKKFTYNIENDESGD